MVVALFACHTLEYDNYDAMYAVLHQAEEMYSFPDCERFVTETADTAQLISELTGASMFFASINNLEKVAKTYLYMGCVQSESDDKAIAMESFKKAENYGVLSGDSLTTAEAEFYIARFLFEDHMYDDMLAMAVLAENNFGRHYEGKAFVNNLIAVSYIMEKDHANAEYYLKRAIDYAEMGNSVNAKQKILMNFAVLKREQGKYNEAFDYLLQCKPIVTDSFHLLQFNMNMAHVYTYDDQYDSAYYYELKALDLLESVKVKPETESSIYFFLYYITKKQMKYELSLYYFEKCADMRYKIQKGYEKKSIYKVQRQYDLDALQYNMSQKVIKNQRVILIISLLLLLASITAIGLMVKQKKTAKEILLIKDVLNKTNEDLHNNSIKDDAIKKELARQLRIIIAANEIVNKTSDSRKEWSSLVKKINNGKNDLFEAALIVFNNIYPDMYDTIKEKYKSLNATESKVMLLSYIDLTNAEIGKLLGLSLHSVYKSRSAINKCIR